MSISRDNLRTKRRRAKRQRAWEARRVYPTRAEFLEAVSQIPVIGPEAIWGPSVLRPMYPVMRQAFVLRDILT